MLSDSLWFDAVKQFVSECCLLTTTRDNRVKAELNYFFKTFKYLRTEDPS